MKILILQRFDLSSVSCARRVLCQSEVFLRKGHEVVLCDYVHQHRQQEIPQVADLSKLGAEILPLNRKAAHLFANIRKLFALDPPPDIVHLWKAYPDASLPALIYARSKNIPLHYDWDDWEKGIARELTQSYLAGWLGGCWDKLTPRLCDTLSVASEFLRKKAVEWGVPQERIWNAPVGADLERFYPRERDEELFGELNLSSPVLVYSGQLEVASYAEQTIDVFAEVRKELHTARLLILGGGRKLEAIKKRAEEKRVRDKVIFTNYVPGNEIPRYLSLADVALAPFEDNDVTRAKSPLKIAEYLAMGLPIVASDVGEAQRMTVGAGVCVPCGDIQGMIEKTLWILKNEGIQKSMRMGGRQLAERVYNWETHVNGLEEAYRLAIEVNR